MSVNLKPNILRVAFPSKQTLDKYEPTNISIDYEYILLENIYSPLVEISKDGVIEPGVAEKIEWIGDELKLTIRLGLKTTSGKLITPDDVLFSLKRLLVLSGNTHGNFKDIVCPGVKLKSIEDECPGLRIDGTAVYIGFKGGKSFLLPMLSAIDFAVIPKSGVDPKTLKIVDFTETSGVYSVSHQDADGSIHLKINPNHYHSSKHIAQEIVFVPSNIEVAGSSLKMLEEGLVDHITTVDQSRIDHVIDFFEKNKSEFNAHITQKIRTSEIVFTSRGLSELTAEERRYIGAKIKEAFIEIYKDAKGFEPRPEFFPHLSEGSLTAEQTQEFKKIQNSAVGTLTKKFKLGLLKSGDLNTWASPITKRLPTAECYREDNLPDFKEFKNESDIPHAVITATDTGFLEDIGLITYTMNAGFLGLNKSERQKWLSNYMSNDNKSQRIEKLKQLHFDALAKPALVPLMAFPYTALTRKPWRMELSELYANNQLWRIKNQ